MFNHLNNWVKLWTVADALQVARTVSTQALIPNESLSTESKILDFEKKKLLSIIGSLDHDLQGID